MDAQAKEIKNKVMCEINSSQGSSKYQKQKKCTRSEISINLSFYVYKKPKKKQLFFKFKKKKKENGYNLKIGH
jgi:hypothetical protein